MKVPKPECLSETIFLKLKAYRVMLRQTCPDCNGSGVKAFNEQERSVTRCPACSGKFENLRRYLEVNISPRHVEFTLDAVKENFDKKCHEAFKVMIDNIVQVIATGHVFISQKSESTSFGVSTMGTILLKSLVDLNYDCCVVSAQEISDCFFNFSDDKTRNDRLSKLLDYYESVQVLMITEFSDQFKSTTSSFRGEKFMDFLLKRKINNRHVIFCSSVHWKTFEVLYSKLKLPEHIKGNAIRFELQTNTARQRTSVADNLAKLPGMNKLAKYLDGDEKKLVSPPKEIKEDPPPIPHEIQPKISEEIIKSTSGIRRTTNAKKKPNE